MSMECWWVLLQVSSVHPGAFSAGGEWAAHIKRLKKEISDGLIATESDIITAIGGPEDCDKGTA
jgi:hypothetical protein